MILERRNNNIKKDKILYEASFENQGYSDEFLKASNYPDRYKIDEVFHELESETLTKPITSDFIEQRGKDIINVLKNLLY